MQTSKLLIPMHNIPGMRDIREIPAKKGKPHTDDPGMRAFHIVKHAGPYGEVYIPPYDELLREFAGQY